MIFEPRRGAYHHDPYLDLKTYDFQPIGFALSCLATGGQPQLELFFPADGGEVPALEARSGQRHRRQHIP
ncbi:hypothetical protein A6U97_26305 [Agrobacterium tumefaciens]|nr:hypothetical protein A6U97_26305 [Agrobacterium tumefaciens]